MNKQIRLSTSLWWEFSPAKADCEYRAPLAPRLARPYRWYWCLAQSSIEVCLMKPLQMSTASLLIGRILSMWQRSPRRDDTNGIRYSYCRVGVGDFLNFGQPCWAQARLILSMRLGLSRSLGINRIFANLEWSLPETGSQLWQTQLVSVIKRVPRTYRG